VAGRPSRIIGRPDVFYETTVDAMTGMFALALPPTLDGEQYTIRLVPTKNDTLPPKVVDLAITQDTKVELSFDPIDELPRITGQVLDAIQRGVADMRVQAVHLTEGTLLSTVVTTDATGAFVVRLSRDVASRQVLLTATPTMKIEAPTPTLRREVEVPSSGTSLDIDLALPALPAVTHVKYRVYGVGPSGTQMPIEGASCVFTADVAADVMTASAGQIQAVHQVAGETSGDGVLEVDLFAGLDGRNRLYRLDIATPATSLFQSTRGILLDVGYSGGVSAPVELPRRADLVGRFLDAAGKPVKGVTLSPRPANVRDLVTSMSTSFPQAITDMDGRFLVTVDRGEYDMAFVPPQMMALPRLWIEGVAVDGDFTLGDITASEATAAHGQVYDSSGKILSGATVRLFTIPDRNKDPACAQDDACRAPAELIAEAGADKDGTVTLVLPAVPK
jgi:hypothetical protein